jgi:threonine/homoserine/homoserine lactone efflux protein
MSALLAWKGIVLGISIAAPVGPIGLLCIRRTLTGGLGLGLCTGLGAAAADAVYGAVAGFGLTAVSGFLLRQQFWLALIGGAFLCGLGIRTARSLPPSGSGAVAEATGRAAAFLSTFFLTLTNPMTILSFVALFAGLGVGVGTDFTGTATFVGGVLLGSALWWTLLSGIVVAARGSLPPGALRWVNRISGLVILGFGLAALWSAWNRGPG